MSFVLKEQQRLNLGLWKQKTAQIRNNSSQGYTLSSLARVLFSYHTRLLALRNKAWHIFKRPMIQRSSSMVLAEKLARMNRAGLRKGFKPILELKLTSNALALVSLMNIAYRKEVTKKAKALKLWSRRGILPILRRLSLQATDRKRHALHHWVIRTKTPGIAKSKAMRVKAMSLVLLNKLYRRPFTLYRAFKRWSVNWRFLMQRIVYLMAIQASINEQVAFWRWKRLLTIPAPNKTSPESSLAGSAQKVMGLFDGTHRLNLIIAKRPRLAWNAMM